jgi:hypothetical protein
MVIFDIFGSFGCFDITIDSSQVVMHAPQRLHEIVERLGILFRQTPPRLERQEFRSHGGTPRDAGGGDIVNHGLPP